jgi:ATP-dependent Clp protease ATP-binding subunit ClpC
VTEDLGESGKLALSYARRVAKDLAHEAIGTEHLFLGVAELEDVNIRRQFSALGVDLEEVSLEVKKEAGQGSGGAEEPVLTPQAEKALEVAKEESARLAEQLVEAPHILIGVLRDRDGLAAKKLRDAGADLEALEQRLDSMLEHKKWSPDFYQERKAIHQPDLSKTSTVLETLGRDLTEAAEQGELSPIIGRDREILELVQVMCGKRKNNAVLIGDAGVGKTAIVEGLAQRIVAGEVPEPLRGMRIRTIEVGSLVAGTVYRGQFEGRLKELVDEVRQRKDVILFIDEVHMLIGAGEAGLGSMDAANMLKPVLSEGKLKVVGATTTDEFRKYFEKDKALMRRFQAIVVGEPSREDTVTILEGLRPKYEEFHQVKILDEALEAAVELSVRFMHDRFLPDKALDLLDRACTQEKLGVGMREWMPALAPQADGEAASRDVDLVVDADEVAEVVSVLLEIPIATLTADERKRLLGMSQTLRAKVIGQDHAVDTIAQTILSVRVGMKDVERPYGVFLFLGPTGVGKTKLAEEVAAFLFGDKDEVIRLDMSEYMEKHTVSSLIGSPPGYVGWEEGGKLTNAVRAKPYAVVLLDEVEKAHPDVWNIFLQVFEDGRLTDQAGRLVDFRNTVIIMTSNVGARQIQATGPFGFAAAVGDGAELSYDDIKNEVDRELKRVFAPEFLNRIDEVMVFRPLSRDALRTIIGLLLKEMIPLDLKLTDAALDLLVEESYDPTMGARPARRAIQRLLRNPLSLMLAKEEISDDDTVAVGLSDGALQFNKAGRRREREAAKATA